MILAWDYYENTSLKVNWQGEIVSIQPRARVWKYLSDNRTHYLLGYNMFVSGSSSEAKNQFAVAISDKQQQKCLFRIGDVVEGTAWTKKYEDREFADYYRAGSCAYGQTCPMSRFSGILIKISKNIDLKLFVTDQNYAGYTRWADRVRFPIKTGIRLLMTDIWMSYALKAEIMTIEIAKLSYKGGAV